MTPQEQAIQNYQLKFDELNAFRVEIFTEEFFEQPKEEIKKKFEECLFWFFVDGFSSGILMMGEDAPLPNGYEFLDIRYPDGETVLEKLDKYTESKSPDKLATLLESESHRMYNTGSVLGMGGEIKNGTIKFTPNGKKKTWHTMMDEKVRDQHWMLEGETIPIDEDFVTADGDYGPAPGMFQSAENNANCRCILTYS